MPRACGQLMVGSGPDTYDPICELPAGHEGVCKSTAAIDQHRLSSEQMEAAWEGLGESEGVGDAGRSLTAKEKSAIASLKRLAAKWPESLTLFSWSGSLVIFKTDEWDGRNDGGPTDDANDYIIGHIYGIPNDGGDP